MTTRPADPLAILRERARLLSLPAATLHVAEAEGQLLLFARAQVRYALDLRFVRELLPLQDYTPLPFAPPGCLGLTAARGELIAVFDLATLSGDAPPEQRAHLMLLCGEPGQELALALDDALELVSAGPLRRPPDDEPGPVRGFDERGFLVLDGEALLRDPRLTIDPQNPETFP